jgi:integrase
MQLSLRHGIFVKMQPEMQFSKHVKRSNSTFRPSDLYRLRRLVMVSGERVGLIIDAETGLPVVRANQYLLVVRRDRCQASTLTKEAAILCLVHAWADVHNLELLELFDSGKGLGQNDLAGLIETLRRDFGPSANGGVIRLHAKLVSPSTWAHRISVARDYFVWNLERVLRECEPGTLRYQHVHSATNTLKQRMTESLPRAREESNRTGLSTELRERLLNVISPGSLENPFHKALRARNALIVDIMIGLGLRRGELLKLRTSDVHASVNPFLIVERRPDDPLDPRTNEPQVKTRSRRIPVETSLARRLTDYMVEDRRRIPGAAKSPFLFLARSGQPLSLRGLDNVFAQISLRFPELHELSPHVLRHTANDLFSEIAERADCGREEATSARNYIMGWEPDSTQGLGYSRAHIERVARQLSLDHQRRLFASVD